MPNFNPQMKVRGVNGEINLSQPRQLSAIPQVDIFDPKTSEQVQMAAQQQRNATMSDPSTFGVGAPQAPATPQEKYSGTAWADDIYGRFMTEYNNTQAQRDAAAKDDLQAQKSEAARRRIGAVADAIAAVGNAYGVYKGGYNQMNQPVAYPTISQRVAQDAQLRKANMAVLDQRLNSMRDDVLKMYLGAQQNDLKNRELDFKEDREGRLRYVAENRVRNNDEKLEWDKRKTGINTDFNYAKLGETIRHNRVSEANDATRAGASATSASASLQRAKTGESKFQAQLRGDLPTGSGKRTASGVDEAVASAAKEENWNATKDNMAKDIFGKEHWTDIRVSELTPEQRRVYEQIAGAKNQKDRQTVIINLSTGKSGGSASASSGNGASAGAPSNTEFKDPRKTPPSRRNKGGSGGSEALNDTIPSRRAK